MSDPRYLKIDDFNYELPASQIAAYPHDRRDDSRLLVWKENQIRESLFANILQELPEQSLVVFNNTRVVEARLIFQKSTGARIEVFCLEPADTNITIAQALRERGESSWYCLVGNAAAWPKETRLELTTGDGQTKTTLTAELRERSSGRFLVRFRWWPAHLCFADMLHEAGKVPLPPYIRREAEAVDRDRYQTVYAEQPGSVAAPTAGLHFTDTLIGQLASKKIEKDFVTLHVGAGTFQPVKATTMEGHDMHSEQIEVSLACLEHLYSFVGKNIVAVGTTSLRTLESLYWLGRQLLTAVHEPGASPTVDQWEPYQQPGEVTSKEAIAALITHLKDTGSPSLTASTRLLIAPGYRFRMANVLVTNFHQPKSTLLLLVSAFIGDAWRELYRYAVEKKFRFLSYGDACLLFRQ